MIKIFKTKNEILDYRNSKATNLTIGLVPTMGNLHAGHLSLLKNSILENDISIITIFVNPTQFGPNEDFNSYPRTLDHDLTLIEELALKMSSAKEIAVFAPTSNDEIYPENFSTSISIGPLKNILEGKIRPTHFDGVTTVVFKLFHITKPHNAYFGQKDYQQCVIIQKMILDLELPISMHIIPISRNADGLALSSRNQYLTDTEMKMALTLPKTLNAIKDAVLNNRDFLDAINEAKQDPRWDYLEVLDAHTLNDDIENKKDLVIVGAYKINQTRLLDNIVVKNVR
jgi:pantoate--beta-alanine ligase